MIVTAEITAVHREAMNEAGLAVGNKEGLRDGIVSQPAEGGARIDSAIHRHISEKADRAAHAVDFPDRTRAASWTPQTGHEGRARHSSPNVQRPPSGPGATIGRP